MRLDDGRVLPNFMGQALRGEPLTVYGDGSQTRSFCYVEDLVDGIEKLLAVDFHEPVNLGNPIEVTILEFAHEIIAVVRQQEQDRVSALAAGRSAGAQAGHQPGQAVAGLGAAHRPRRGIAPHPGVFSGKSGPGAARDRRERTRKRGKCLTPGPGSGQIKRERHCLDQTHLLDRGNQMSGIHVPPCRMSPHQYRGRGFPTRPSSPRPAELAAETRPYSFCVPRKFTSCHLSQHTLALGCSPC